MKCFHSWTGADQPRQASPLAAQLRGIGIVVANFSSTGFETVIWTYLPIRKEEPHVETIEQTRDDAASVVE